MLKTRPSTIIFQSFKYNFKLPTCDQSRQFQVLLKHFPVWKITKNYYFFFYQALYIRKCYNVLRAKMLIAVYVRSNMAYWMVPDAKWICKWKCNNAGVCVCPEVIYHYILKVQGNGKRINCLCINKLLVLILCTKRLLIFSWNQFLLHFKYLLGYLCLKKWFSDLIYPSVFLIDTGFVLIGFPQVSLAYKSCLWVGVGGKISRRSTVNHSSTYKKTENHTHSLLWCNLAFPSWAIKHVFEAGASPSHRTWQLYSERPKSFVLWGTGTT